jgi:two-component system sensor histidine kinase/response regulator
MTAMIEDLLDVTRAHVGGGLVLSRSDVDLCEVCRTLVEELEMARGTGVLRLSCHGVTTGSWDRGRISRAVANLMKNALVHGTRAAPVEVSVDGGDDQVRIVVRNEGPAIPAELRDVLFEPFRRGHQADGDRLGLGLYIVQQIVEAHGGSLSYESHDGQPTTFTIDLPRHRDGS